MMPVSIVYKPNSGIVYEEAFIPWGTTRKNVREMLQEEYDISDHAFEGIVSRRDIYRNLKGQPVYLFLNYDSNECFSELEIHEGVELNIFDKTINFEMLFWDVVDCLGHLSSNPKIIDDGEVLFVDLKLNLCSAASMGGDDENNQLAYIYCAQHIDHLLA
jgi:hypothetical protein